MGKRKEVLAVALEMAGDLTKILHIFDDPGMELREVSMEIYVYNCRIMPPRGPFARVQYMLDFFQALPEGLDAFHIQIRDGLGKDDQWRYHEQVLKRLQVECVRVAQRKVGGLGEDGEWEGHVQQWEVRKSPRMWKCEVRSASTK